MTASPPASAQVQTVAARDGTPLLTRRWPTAGDPWGTVLVVHGLGEHSGRHDATGGRFAAAGLVATSFDHRGFGASGGRRADVDRWEDLLDDIEDRLDAGRVDGLPAAMYAHSLGGLIAADYLLSERPQPDVAVLSAPALGGGTPLLRGLSSVLARVRPTIEVANPWKPGQIARDPAPAVVTDADPLSVPRTTARLGRRLFDAMDRVNADLEARNGFPMPTLIVHGGDDTLVPTASTAFLERFPTTERRGLPGRPPRAAPRSTGRSAGRGRDHRVVAATDGRRPRVSRTAARLAGRIGTSIAAIRNLGPAIAAATPLPADARLGPDEDAWGPREVLAHATEAVGFWHGEIERILAAGPDGPLPSFGRGPDDVARVAIIARDRDLPATVLLGRLAREGDAAVARIARLTPDELGRVGRHPAWGEMTVGEIIEATLASHLAGHVDQLRDLVATGSDTPPTAPV